MFPVARAGASFHAAISIGKFHGMIWPATPIGRDAASRERVLELVGPARVVEEVRGRERDVDVARLLDRLAAVHRLQHRELARPLLELPGDPVEVLRALGAGELAPRCSEASRAASTASATSSGPASAICASGSSVAGLIVTKRFPDFGSTNSPSMNSPYESRRGVTTAVDSGAGAYSHGTDWSRSRRSWLP